MFNTAAKRALSPCEGPNADDDENDDAVDENDDAVDEDDDAVEGNDDAVEDDDDAVEKPVKKRRQVDPRFENRSFLVFYGKNYYKVPAEAVVFDSCDPFPVDSGLKANKLHECKSFTKWNDHDVHTRHFIKIKINDAGVVRTGLYITFRINDQESDDPFVIRAVHKNIYAAYYEAWTKPHAEGGWSDLKRKRLAELIADKPSDEAQINPRDAKWQIADAAPSRILYARPKKEKKKNDESANGAGDNPLSHKRTAADMLERDDDCQSSAAQSSTALAVHNAPPPAGGMPAMPGGAINFYATSPGMVTISEELYNKMAKAFYSQ